MHGAGRHCDQLACLHGQMLVIKADFGLPTGDVKQLKQVGMAVWLDVQIMQARPFRDAFKVEEFRLRDRLRVGCAIGVVQIIAIARGGARCRIAFAIKLIDRDLVAHRCFVLRWI